MLKKVLLIAVFALLIGGMLAVLTVAVHYYKQHKQITVFPDHLAFYRAANEKLADRASTDTDSSRRLVLFGDSRVFQWSPLPEIDGFESINRGVSGETTAQMRYRFEQDVLSLKPEVLVIQAGINDLVAAGSLPDLATTIVHRTAENLSYFATTAAAQGIEVIILSVIQPATPPLHRRLVWSSEIEDYVNSVNAAIDILASRSSKITAVDTNELLQGSSNKFETAYATDTLHINSAAYRNLNSKLTALVESLHGI